MARTTVDVSLRADVSQLLKELGSIEGVSKKEARAMLKQFQNSYKDMEKASKIAADTQAKALRKMTKDTGSSSTKIAEDVTELGQKAMTELGGIFSDLEGIFDIAKVSAERTGFGVITAFAGAAAAVGLAVTALNAWVENTKAANREIASTAGELEEFTAPHFSQRLTEFAEHMDLIDISAKRLAAEGFMQAKEEALDFEHAMLVLESNNTPQVLANIEMAALRAAAAFGGSGAALLDTAENLGERVVLQTKAAQSLNQANAEVARVTDVLADSQRKALSPLEKLALKEAELREEFDKARAVVMEAEKANREAANTDRARAANLRDLKRELREKKAEIAATIEVERQAILQAEQKKKADKEAREAARQRAEAAREQAQAQREAAQADAAAGKAASLLLSQEMALATPMEKVNLAHEERVKNIRALLTEYPELEDAERALELEAKRWASEQEKVNTALKKTEDQKTSESLAKLAEDTALAASVVNQLADAAAGFAALTLDKFTELADARTTAFEDQQSREAELHQARLERELERGDISQGQFDLEMTQLAAKQAAEAANFEALTEREQKAVKRAFAVQQAAAVSGVLMQGAQAYVAFLTAFSPLLLGAPKAAAGVVAPFVAAQLATIAAQKPPMEFASGGMVSPDHMLIGAQSGEAVLSRRGVAAIGGPSAIEGINRGVAPAPANFTANIILDRRVIGKAISKMLPQSSQTVGRVAIFGGA